MSEIAISFLVANLAAGIAILAVLLLRKPVRKMFGAPLAYALWALVPLAAASSLLPPRIMVLTVHAAPAAETPAALSQAASGANSAKPLAPDIQPVSAPVDLAESMPSLNGQIPRPSAEIAQPVQVDLWGLAALLWFAGVIAALVWQLRNQTRFMADARAGLAGPAVAGFLRPRIVTPSDFEERFEAAERQVILAHEAIHISRGDARVNALVALVRCLCWFNPLVHVAVHVQRIDQELACDAAVTERHPRARAVYASALLKAQMAARPLPLGCYWPSNAPHPLMERIEMLKHARPSRGTRIAGAGAIAMLAVGAGLTAWAAKPAYVRTVFEVAQAPLDETSDTWLYKSAPEALAAAHDAAVPAPIAPVNQTPPPGLPTAAMDQAKTLLVIDAADPVYLRGHVEKIEFGRTSYVAYVRAESVTRTATDPIQPEWQLWQLSPTHYWGGDEASTAVTRDILNKFVNISGERYTDKSCAPACHVHVRDFVKCPEGKGYAPGFGPQCIDAPKLKAAAQAELQLAQAQRQQQQTALQSAAQGAVPSASDAYDPADPVYLRGKVERIDFADRNYTVYVRAASIAESETAAAKPDNRLWQLSPTPYWGDKDSRDATNDDLANANILVRGFNAKDKSCRPNCRLLPRAILVPKAAALPVLGAKSPFGVVDVTKTYDTGRRYFIEGKVQRIEFSERMLDAYVQTEAKGTTPASLFQVRSEYRQPRADIEKHLLNKTVKVAGWPAYSNLRGVNLQLWSTYANCSASCAMYGTDFVLPDNLRLMPAGEVLLTDPVPAPAAFDPDGTPVVQPPPTAGPRAERLVTLDALTLTGRVIDAKAYNQGFTLTVEEISRKPQAFAGAKPGTMWTVDVRSSVLPRVAPERQKEVEAAEAQAWVGKIAVFQREGFIVGAGGGGVSTKDCDSDCHMPSTTPLIFD